VNIPGNTHISISESHSTVFGLRQSFLPFAFCIVVCLFFPFFDANAQDTINSGIKSDTTKVREHSPKRATYYSMILPGLGQAYNRKYWKIPVVYAGFGTVGYFIVSNTRNYKSFRDAYSFKLSGSSAPPPNDLVNRYSSDQLLVGREYYRRNLEVSYITAGLWYILTMVDAAVDAHFFNYDISEDLSMQVNPWSFPSPDKGRGVAGITLTMRF